MIYITSCSVSPGGGDSKTGKVRVQRVKQNIKTPFCRSLNEICGIEV